MADGIALRFGFTPYNAEQERLLAQVLDMPASATSGRAGVRPGSGFEVTVGGSPEVATVAAGSCVITDPAGGGTYRVVIPAPVQLALPTRPASGSSRIHEVVARILNTDHRSTDGAREVDLYIAEGAPAPAPVAPTVAAGRLRLRRLVVPSSGAISVTSIAQRTVAVGGILPVASEAERDAISPVWDGLKIYREDTDRFESRVDGAWQVDARNSDTGWLPVTLASGFLSPNGFPVEVRVVAGLAHWRGRVERTAGAAFAAGTNINVIASGGIPAAARPKTLDETITPIGSYHRGIVGDAYADLNGSATIRTPPGATSTGWMMRALSGYRVD